MDFLNEFTSDLVSNILRLLLTALAGYLGFVFKNLYKRFVDSKIKESVVKNCVKAVEQTYRDIHGEDKLNKAIESASALLSSKGIAVTSEELKVLIEASVAEFNNAFQTTTN